MSEQVGRPVCERCSEEYEASGEWVDICPRCRTEEARNEPRWQYANLGCGDDYRNGWWNVDLRPGCDPDEVVDFDYYPWPWDDDSFEKVLMDNVIEHLDDRCAALHELTRVVEPGGTIILRFPHWNSPGHYTNPTHTKTLTRNTFDSEPVNHLFTVKSVDCTRVRFGRVFPKKVALVVAEHVGHVVSEVEVQLRVTD